MVKTLDYLFIAKFADGFTIEQTSEDKSTIAPPDSEGNGKSAYYDVLQKDGLVEFILENKELNHVISVNLLTGEFTENDKLVVIDYNLKNIVFPITLVYERECEAVFSYDQQGNTAVDNRVLAYNLGWEGEDSQGNKVCNTIRVLT